MFENRHISYIHILIVYTRKMSTIEWKNKYLQQSTTQMQYNYRPRTKKNKQENRTNNNHVRFSKYSNKNRPGYGV